MAIGHVNSSMSSVEINKLKELRECGVHYIPLGDANINNFSKIDANKNALFLGIGLTFFDYMEALTNQRGGKYYDDGDVLSYTPSGREPIIYITSRTGIPYHARGYNEKKPDERWKPRFITEDYISSLKNKKREISFGRDLWKNIVNEIELSYTLSEMNSGIDEGSIIESIVLGPESYKRKRESLGLSSCGFPWRKVLNPEIVNQNCYSINEYQKSVLDYLDNDIESAQEGNKSNPFKAALDVLRDIRNEVRIAIQGGSISDRSYQEEVNYFYTPLNKFLSIGPPIQRIRELSALIKSGVAKILPPSPFINYDKKNKIVSVSFKEPFFEDLNIDYLIEARQQKFIMSKSSDYLINESIDTGILSPHIYSCGSESGAINISHTDFNVIDKNGNLDKKIFCYGVPTEGITWGTAATIRPFINSVIFQNAEIIVNKIKMDLENEK